MVQVCPRLGAINVITRVIPWRKSPKASMVYILTIGAGGNGAAGLVDGVTGGGGGGSGGQTMVLLPAPLVPDVLYVSNFSNTDAGSMLMGVFVHPIATTLATWRAACVAYANFGADGSGSTGGAAGAIATVANMPRGYAGIVNALAGQAGAAGGASGVGGSISYPVTGLLSTGGAGGGATNNVGGAITGSLPRPEIAGALTSSDMTSGVNFVNGALMPCGGSGGYGVNNSSKTDGGAGGIGGYGGGGGGGGSASPVGVGGPGGAGGAGLIVIAQW